MPGSRTSGATSVPASVSREASAIPVGSGMRTVPSQASSAASIRQGTGPSAPETPMESASASPGTSPRSRASSAPRDIVALPQNSPPIICSRASPSM